MTLVEIPTTEYIEGWSPVLKRRQRIDERVLTNLLAFAFAFWLEFNRQLVVTEASRSRPRQDDLWTDYQRYLHGGPYAVVAAKPYNSLHDEINHGTAIDFGSGIATLGTPAQKWAAENGPRYGWVWTGVNFGEAWHYEGRTTTTPASAGFITVHEENDMFDAAAEARLIGAIGNSIKTARINRPVKLYQVIGSLEQRAVGTNGKYWAVPEPAYLTLLDRFGLVAPELLQTVTAEEFQYVLDLSKLLFDDSTNVRANEVFRLTDAQLTAIAAQIPKAEPAQLVLTDEQLDEIRDAAQAGGAEAIKDLSFVTVVQ